MAHIHYAIAVRHGKVDASYGLAACCAAAALLQALAEHAYYYPDVEANAITTAVLQATGTPWPGHRCAATPTNSGSNSED